MKDTNLTQAAAHGAAGGAVTPTWDGPALFRGTRLTFDPGDKSNGSLYLCDPSNGQHAEMVEQAIRVLRAQALWSAQDAKQVRDDQRQAYEAQLVFVEAAEFTCGGAQLVLARCDHPKFPSSADRFSAWKKALGTS